ncbi:hypothetical protein HUJ04_005158 [Dendroctonus ponderosae]|uniref:AB hydrolase-1 domain-containing protein n=1 Tax=Dendroctonus ponderosae TaxID=77166 RepID=A0AAR5QIS9_DENPD|nr:hypothetical protein HUJ04_005158 [Dendroctonus ponderosae]
MSDDCQRRGWWTKYSETKLIEVENSILSVIKSKFRTWFVSIGSTVGKDDKIWTIALNEESDNTPIVMLHGFAAGIGFWCKNFDEIARDRSVYAIDLLGFGRSSRPVFSKNHETSEQQWVSTIEEWRKKVNLEKFILLGHSFGGYLATSYAISYPERVRHLILADPWGFGERPENYKSPSVPLYYKLLFYLFYPLVYFNPLASVRAAGPLGPALVHRMRRDIARRYEDQFENSHVITEYIYQCNSQYPSGETAFHSFLKDVGWAKNPMIHRFDLLHEDVPITIMYGEDSWIDPQPGLILHETRGHKSYINIDIIASAGHHIYSDQPDMFNKFVQDACTLVDNSLDKKGMIKTEELLNKHKRLQAGVKDESACKEVREEEVDESAIVNKVEHEVTFH